MSKKFSFKNSSQKNGLYFIVFIVAAALILVWYFSSQSPASENENKNENQNVNSSTSLTVNENKNENNNENVNINENQNNNANTNTATGGENLENQESDLGLTVIGYDNVTKTVNDEITNLDLDASNSISIMPQSYEGIVKNSISIQTEENIEVDGISGVKLTGGSAKDGSTVSLVIIKTNDQLYHFSGTEVFLDNLNSFIKFNK